MSISAKPWDSAGGGASVPDASETTKGKIKIATTSESNTGTDDLTAMTPAKVKARIDAALVGGVEYKGTWNATTGLPTLINAVKGDLYKVGVAGTIYGKVWAVGDQLIINDDMGGSITNTKIDKIDNTEAVTSVNALTGAVMLSMDNIQDVISGGSSSGDLLMYDGSDWNNTAKSSIAVSAFNDDNTYQPKDAGLTSISGLTTAADKMIYTSGSDTYAVTDLTSAGRALLDDANATAQRSTLGLVIGTDVSAIASPAFTGSPTAPTQSAGDDSTKIATTAYVDAAVTAGGGATDLNGLSDVTITSAASGNLLQHNGSGQFINVAKSTISVGTFNDDNTYQPKDAGLTSIAGLTTAADKMIYTSGSDTYAVTDLTSAGRALLDDANATAQRSTLGLGSAALSESTDFQPIDAGLTSISGLTTAADKMIYTSGSDTYAVTDLTSAGRALLDDANATAQRATLGLVIGTDVSAIASPSFTGSPTAPTQSAGDDSTKIATTAYVDAAVTAGGGATDLNGLSDVTITSAASGNLLQHNGSGQFINVAKGTINVGTFNDDNTYQPKDAGLTSIAGLTTAADKMIFTDGSDSYAVTDLTSAGRALLDDADASAQRTTLGLVIGTNVLGDVVDDTSPELGGDLDVLTRSIISSSNRAIKLTPDGSGLVEISGNATSGSGQIKLNCEQNTHGIKLKSPPHSANADYTLVFPNDLGTSGQVLTTNGGGGTTTGTLTWTTASGGGSAPVVTEQNTNATLSAPSSGVIEEIYTVNAGSTVTLTLVSSATCGEGFKYNIKRLGGGSVVVQCAGSDEFIDVASQKSYTISSQYDSVTLVANNTSPHASWLII